jgi:hypothetical protein
MTFMPFWLLWSILVLVSGLSFFAGVTIGMAYIRQNIEAEYTAYKLHVLALMQQEQELEEGEKGWGRKRNVDEGKGKWDVS